MAVTNGWGQGVINNANGYGKLATNNIGAGSIYENSYSGDTALIGTSAAFSYSASSFTQADSNPTPTITGNTGGTFSGTSGLVFVSTSTGEINLSASTIAAHVVTYTVDGVSATFNLSVTAAPYASTSSFTFDGVNDYFDAGTGLGDSLGTYTGDLTLSFWFNTNSLTANRGLFYIGSFSNAQGEFQVNIFSNSIRFRVDGATSTKKLNTPGLLSTNNWYHIGFVYKAGDISGSKVYLNGAEQTTEDTGTFPSSLSFSGLKTIIGGYYGTGKEFDGELDEVSIWDSALSSAAVAEIAAGPNSLTSLTNASSSNLKAWYKMGE